MLIDDRHTFPCWRAMVGPEEQFRSGEFVIHGIRSPYLAAGPADDAEAVVFLHGNPGSSRDWQDLVPLAGGFSRAIAFDLPGFGAAGKPEEFGYSVAGYARHLSAAFEELGISRAHLVLHDFGGAFGLAWAVAHPRQTASLTLINIGVLLDYEWHYLARIWRTPVLGELFMATANRPAFHLLLKHGNPRGLSDQFVDRMYRDFDRGTRRAILQLYRATDDPSAMAREWAGSLGRLDCPVLVIWGERDPYVPVSLAHRQREVFPEAEVVLLAESGHWPFADNPEQVAGALIPFLRRATGSGANGASVA